MKQLSMLKEGEKGIITEIKACGPLKRRLMDMGILVGEVVQVDRYAPLNGPIAVTVKNYQVSFRKQEANGISVEEIQ